MHSSQSSVTSSPWFEYPLQVHPHHTDYAGIVWHGSYIRWMEEARVHCLEAVGLSFAQLVEWGFDLPVVDLQIRYRQALKMGATGRLKAKMEPLQRARIPWSYELWSVQEDVLHLTAQVSLVVVDRASSKILRQLPATLSDALNKIYCGEFLSR